MPTGTAADWGCQTVALKGDSARAAPSRPFVMNASDDGRDLDLANEVETRVSNPPEALAILENLKALKRLRRWQNGTRKANSSTACTRSRG